ncbi:MAG: DNA polymerase III subunit delta' [Patescibacteria group bacterium]|nr:DNA polymerase III subunit delta' [Patescibacteria group bacterium]
MLEIIGHQKIVNFLKKSISGNNLAHTYLFYGPSHIGKTKVAEFFATSLICQNPKSGNPCGECQNCLQIQKRIHPDVYWVVNQENKSQISIEQIRQLKENLSLEPFCAPYKVAIIEEADNLTIQAANSFLKLLEESASKTVIILIAKSFRNIPLTIRSRSQIIRFSFPKKTEIISSLTKDFKLSDKEAENIFNLSLGRPGSAMELVSDPQKIKEYQKFQAVILNELAKNNFLSRFEIADLLSDSSSLSNLLKVIRDLILFKLGIPTSSDLTPVLTKVAKIYSMERLVKFTSEILKTQMMLRQNVSFKIAIENLLINL